jgi:ferritin
MPDDSVQSVFQSVYETEIGTTATLEAMYRIANESGDYLTCQWLVDSKGLIVEQVEEENKAQTILDRIAICGVEGAALAAFDSWIGSL